MRKVKHGLTTFASKFNDLISFDAPQNKPSSLKMIRFSKFHAKMHLKKEKKERSELRRFEALTQFSKLLSHIRVSCWNISLSIRLLFTLNTFAKKVNL